MSSERLIHVDDISKCFPIFASPKDRLLQMFVPRIMKLLMPFSSKSAKKYYREFWALRNVSLEVMRGEMVGVIGRNGSGKSTLLQIICGILQVDSGNAATQGRISALLELGAGFNPEFTGRENVYMNAAILGLPESEITKRFDDIVAFSEVGDFIDQPVKTYSSGMFMRLAFSVAVSVDPDIVIVDEALAVGDIGFYMKCMQRIEEMIERGVTFLLVTHDMSLVRSMCTRAIYLRSGECVFDGDAETATEMFLMDIRGEQAGGVGQKMSFREPLNEGSLAFGTGLGKLLDVELFTSSESKTWFHHGDRIDVKVGAWLSNELRAPAIAIAIRDHKGIVVCGMDSRRGNTALETNAQDELSCQFSFDAKLLPGVYNLALRVLDFPFGASDVLIEKQLNAISFEIIDNGQVPIGSSGFVELNGVCHQIHSNE